MAEVTSWQQVDGFRVSLDEAAGLAWIVPARDVTVAEINEFRAGFLLQSGMRRLLWDLRDGDLSDMSQDEVRALSKPGFQGMAGTRLAFVVPRPVDFGVSRMIAARMQLAGTSSTIGHFYDIDAARQWLLDAGEPEAG